MTTASCRRLVQLIVRICIPCSMGLMCAAFFGILLYAFIFGTMTVLLPIVYGVLLAAILRTSYLDIRSAITDYRSMCRKNLNPRSIL